MQAITTFPPNAWNIYAKTCISRMVKLWPGSIRAYFEGPTPPAFDGVEFRPLNSPDRDKFLAYPKPVERKGFLWDAKRFCHKVFAQLDAAQDGEPFWWIDADVYFMRKPPRGLFVQDDVVTFLGRDSYTETGLIGFNPQHPEWKWFKDRYSELYTRPIGYDLDHPGIYDLDDGWTDCHAFDWARMGRGKNLTPNGKGYENVMQDSEFGPFMAHYKGPLKADLYRMGGV